MTRWSKRSLPPSNDTTKKTNKGKVTAIYGGSRTQPLDKTSAGYFFCKNFYRIMQIVGDESRRFEFIGFDLGSDFVESRIAEL